MLLLNTQQAAKAKDISPVFKWADWKLSVNGEEIPATVVKHEEVEFDTSYNGCTTYNLRMFRVPQGTLYREYSAWGGGLEHSEVVWFLSPYIVS